MTIKIFRGNVNTVDNEISKFLCGYETIGKLKNDDPSKDYFIKCMPCGNGEVFACIVITRGEIEITDGCVKVTRDEIEEEDEDEGEDQ